MPQHIVHETYREYERRTRGPTGLFVGLIIGIIGIILFGLSYGIIDRILFGGMVILGGWLMWRGFQNMLRHGY